MAYPRDKQYPDHHDDGQGSDLIFWRVDDDWYKDDESTDLSDI